MARNRRLILSKCVYEICFRARQGLPLVARMIIRFVTGCVIARTQRDDKVILCHDISNGSHVHAFVVTNDALQCVRFYTEVQKKSTEILKRLLGLDYMQIWEGEPMVAQVLDLDEAVERISYIYANPAQDNLEDTIERFPGFSSWYDFKKAGADLDAAPRETFPWVRLPTVPTLSSANPTFQEEIRVIRSLRERNKETHDLVRYPNAWMRCFGITTSEEAEKVNIRIVRRLREREEAARKLRVKKGKKVLGAHQLKTQPIMGHHKPKKKDRKIYVLSSSKELRIRFIHAFQDFCAQCRECYLRYLAGDFAVQWPPGAFKPPIPPNLNLLPEPASFPV